MKEDSIMGFWDSIKNMFTSVNNVSNAAYVDLTPEEKSLLSKISAINRADRDITPELYQQLRNFEIAWLDRRYDPSTIEKINLIPISKDIPRAPAPKFTRSGPGHTGEVYYYLRYKAYQHEEAGNIVLAIACMQKSVALAKCRDYYSADDCTPLAKMLARAGFIQDAKEEMRAINRTFGKDALPLRVIEAEIRRGNELRDFLWLQTYLPSKCPKSISSYRRMKTQNTKNFQTLKALAAEQGRDI